jgi:hypothetical protein
VFDIYWGKGCSFVPLKVEKLVLFCFEKKTLASQALWDFAIFSGLFCRCGSEGVGLVLEVGVLQVCLSCRAYDQVAGDIPAANGRLSRVLRGYSPVQLRCVSGTGCSNLLLEQSAAAPCFDFEAGIRVARTESRADVHNFHWMSWVSPGPDHHC